MNNNHDATIPPFWGGDAHDLGVVSPLPVRTFRELVDRKLNIAVTLNLTRQQYQALPKQQKSRAKRVPYVVPCSFLSSPSRRVTEQVHRVSLVCLDIDDPAQARPLVTAPELVATALMPFSFAVYKTASSTPENPRLRVMVHADSLPASHYAGAVHLIARFLGIPQDQVTRESLTVVQPMFLPTIFRGDDELEDHPLLVYDVEGRALRVADLTDGKGPQAIDPMFRGPTGKANPPQDPATPFDATSGVDALDYLRPVVEAITLEDTEDALKHVDPDLPYPEWLEIAAAMRHQFAAPEDTAERAYQLFDKWSSTGEKYAGEHDTRAKWDSLRPTPPGRVPVTIRSLLKRAQERGWNSVAARQRCFTTTVAWIHSPARTSAELLNEGVSRILATPMVTKAEEEALLNYLVEDLRTRFGVKVSVATLRKDLSRCRATTQTTTAAAAAAAATVTIPPWAKGICYVASVNLFYRRSTGESFSPEALDNAYSRKLLPTQEQLMAAAAAGNTSVSPSKPLMRPRDYLLNHVKIPAVYDFVYDPRCPSESFIDVDGRPCVNLYIPTYPEPLSSAAPPAADIFMRHLTHLVGEPLYRQVLMDFLAYQVQHPGRKIRWAVLLQGAEGCGKTFIAEAMRAVLGNGHVKTVDCSALHSGYNDWAYGSQLITLEEIRVAGQSRHEVMNALKPLISNDTISINQKYRDQRTVDNVTNYLLFTNHPASLVLTAGDRRYFVLQSAMQTKEQVTTLGLDYFRQLFGMLRTHAAGLRHWLENWCIDPSFNPSGHAPRTTYMYQLLHDAAPAPVIMVRDAIADRVHPLVTPDLVSSTSLMNWILVQGSPAQLGGAISVQQLGSILRDEGFTNRGRHEIGTTRHYLWARIGTPMASCKDLREVAINRLDEWEKLSPEEIRLL
jgi:hypothetical protein